MINNSLFRPSVIKATRRKFNPEGFDLAVALKAREADVDLSLPPPKKPELSEFYINGLSDCQPIEFINNTPNAETELVIQAVYKQVFGNAHLMESERLLEAESQLCSGQITVMEFARRLAKSERYRILFFDECPNLRAIELNFKHLLGRAPESHAEISKHIQILTEEGFEAEIDSYLDSDEYFHNFGTNIVPYYRGYKTQTGRNIAGFTYSFQLLRGASSSDKSTSDGNPSSQLQAVLIGGKSAEIHPLSTPPAPVQKILILKPAPVVEKTFKDLDCSPRYKSPEFLATPIPPNIWLQQYKAREAAATFPAARESQPVKLFNRASVEELEVVIRIAYKQVFGNVHLMESQRLLTDESKLKDGQLTVKDFIRELAKSDIYRSLFFDCCPNIRAVELNFKHLLGRAPDSSQEISEHLAILTEGSFTAEIDSYLDSQEYEHNFGQDTVPYYVSYETQAGKSVAGYNHIFQLVKGSCSSDRSIATSIISSRRSQLQWSLLKKAEIKEKIVFNPKGFSLAKALGVYRQQQEPQVSSTSDPYIKAFADIKPIELVFGDSAEKLELVIETAYQQVFSNAHLMESERFPQIESQLRSGRITVMEFIRLLAKSERYRDLFFSSCTNLTAIELNFKHLLGRTPENHAEISWHIRTLTEKGFEAEIDSYLDSDEYFQCFGTNIVPYYRGYKTQIGKSLPGFTHSFQLLRGASSSDKSITRDTYAELGQTLLRDRYSQITSLSKDSTASDTTTQIPEQSPSALDFLNSSLVSIAATQPVTPSQHALEASNGLHLNQRAAIWETQFKALSNVDPIKFTPGHTEQDARLAIRAIYKQVLGNAHIMESEHLTVVESQLIYGSISVREFVRTLAKSELYKSRFIDNSPRYRSHELNFKHLLGRAPDSYQETIYHSNLIDNEGYEVDIDSYIDSEEYQEAFGENTVPYYRGYKTQTGKRLLGYTNMFEMLTSISTSDQAVIGANKSRLQKQLMYNNPNGKQPITDVTALVRKVLKLI